MLAMARFFFLLLTLNAVAFGESKPESFYRDLFAKESGGKTEVTLPDKTRCDVVTATHAVEVEFAAKWCEGLGQALWYGFQLDKQSGIVLILRKPEDQRFVIRLKSLLEHRKLTDVKLWIIKESNIIENQ